MTVYFQTSSRSSEDNNASRLRTLCLIKFTVGFPEVLSGALFFPGFVNDLLECVISQRYGYADDFNITGTNPDTVVIDINKIWKWCEKNLMAVNVKKSLVLPIKGYHDIIASGNKYVYQVK